MKIKFYWKQDNEEVDRCTAVNLVVDEKLVVYGVGRYTGQLLNAEDIYAKVVEE